MEEGAQAAQLCVPGGGGDCGSSFLLVGNEVRGGGLAEFHRLAVPAPEEPEEQDQLAGMELRQAVGFVGVGSPGSQEIAVEVLGAHQGSA